MVGENWSLTGKPCDSCKATSATVFCRADSAFLCLSCDSNIHAANKLASGHARVFVCEVCEHAPATVTCKADAAALCATCDRDIHSANPLARRHDRVPVVPFFDSAVAAKCFTGAATGGGDDDHEDSCSKEEEAEAEVEAGSWLLLGPNYTKEVDSESPEEKTIDYLFNDMDSYLDMGLITGEQKPNAVDQFDQQQQFNHNSDGVVPVQAKNDEQNQFHDGVVDGYPTYDMDYAAGSAKHFMYNFSPQCISQSISSSSMDTAVVPDQNAISDVSRNDALPTPISGLDREARVLRYREKRKNRKFEKTIRYASRKAYAETRPRIKGRFAKRTEVEIDSLLASDASSYGVVPTY